VKCSFIYGEGGNERRELRPFFDWRLRRGTDEVGESESQRETKGKNLVSKFQN
jgi:hypothetical protein